jgi:RecB family exonuclease
VRSLFVDDIADRFADAPLERRRRRPLGAAGWAADEAPTPREAMLAAAADAPPAAPRPLGPVSAEVMAQAVPADRPLSATAIEAFHDCPVKWFVGRLLDPQDLVPDPEAMVRGSVAHEVLAAVFAGQAGRPLRPEDLPAARGRMHAALAGSAASRPISVNPDRVRAEVRRLESDLIRYLENVAHDGSALGPVEFEREFCVDLGPFELHGFMDRIDADGSEAVIVDYKGKTATAQAKWLDDGKLQLGLYLLAARRLAAQSEFPGEPVGGLYQPLGNPRESRPRGALLEGADPGRAAFSTDRMGAEEFEDLLGQVLAAAEEAVAQLRAGALEPRPTSCAYGGGCEYPTICRCDAA